MRIEDVRRVTLASFVRPADETATGSPRVEAVYGYLIRHGKALILLDTGIGRGDQGTEDWYRPRRVPLPLALGGHGVELDDIDIIINCHLHFDHCGGNHLFANKPVVCQRIELATARAGDYTFEELLDYQGAQYDLLDGESEILPGIHVIPTPGHVAGHQSLVAQCDNGALIVAGQSHDTASAFSADVLAVQAAGLGHVPPLPTAPAWMSRLLEFDPKRVVFAHDAAVWEPEPRAHPAARPSRRPPTEPGHSDADRNS